MPREPRTLMEYAIGKKGVLKGTRVVSFVAQWTMASQALGRPITVEEYAEWWRESRRTAFRHQAEFREVFGIPNPQPFADQILVRAEALQHGVNGVGRLPLDALTA